jgi:hypothetical protein
MVCVLPLTINTFFKLHYAFFSCIAFCHFRAWIQTYPSSTDILLYIFGKLLHNSCFVLRSAIGQNVGII